MSVPQSAEIVLVVVNCSLYAHPCRGGAVPLPCTFDICVPNILEISFPYIKKPTLRMLLHPGQGTAPPLRRWLLWLHETILYQLIGNLIQPVWIGSACFAGFHFAGHGDGAQNVVLIVPGVTGFGQEHQPDVRILEGGLSGLLDNAAGIHTA